MTQRIRHVQRNVIPVLLLNLHRRVSLGRGGTANHQRDVKIQPLHFLCDVHHFVQRRGDQTAQADDIHVLFFCGLQDLVAGHHNAHVDDLVVVALQHHAYDVLADIVHITLDRCHQDLAFGFLFLGLLCFDVRDQVRDRLLHYPGTLDHLGQEHLA